MKIQTLICFILVSVFSEFCQAESHKVDFSKPNMEGWASETSSKTINYSKKRYISGGGGGISGGGGGGRWVTDWQKNKKTSSNPFVAISSDIARINTVKPFASSSTTHMTDSSLKTIFISPRLDLTINDNDKVEFAYRHKSGFDLRVYFSSDSGNTWSQITKNPLSQSSLLRSKKYNLESFQQTNNGVIKFEAIDKAGRVMGNPTDFLEIKNISTPPYYNVSLQKAAALGNLELTKTLLSNGKDANEYKHGHSPLHVAAFHGQIDIANELVKAGAKINSQLDPNAIDDVELKNYTVEEGDNYVSIAEKHNLMPTHFLRLNKIMLKGTALKYNPPTFKIGEVVKVIDASAGPEWFRHTRALKGQDGKLENPLGFSQVLGRVPALTPLELACVSGKTEMVSWLIKNGANPDGAPGIHNGLWTALRYENEALLRVLLEGGADVNIERGKGDTPFRVVCTRGLPYFAEILIEAGANYNFKEKSLGKTSLRAAAHFGQTEMVQLLLDKGLDPDVRDDWGWTPLHVAINPETAKALIDGGADIHAKAKDGNEAIHSLVGENMLDSVKYLLSIGVDVDTHGKNNMTPLHQASIFNHIDGAELLIKNGADIKAVDDNGMTCLHFARSEGMTKYLISKGANINASAKDKTTPLHFASNKLIASLLINNGANLAAKDSDGATPLHWAVSSREDVSRVLIDAEAPINAKDASGSTPLDYASNNLQAFLIKKGAKLGRELVLINYNPTKHELVISGMAGAIYELQYSSNLKKWDALTKLTMENSTKIYFDNTSHNSSKRFYRLKLSD